tara:strand:+ start:6288 stop:6809 length:522 start_codon:yes stop_codon:yes gene_type:complete
MNFVCVFDLDMTLYNSSDFINSPIAHIYYNSFTKKSLLLYLLNTMPCAKFIFTNATHSHAKLVLETLGLREIFPEKHIISTDMIDNKLKPLLETYVLAEQKFKIRAPQQTILFFEDQLQNLVAAKKRNWTTILITDTRTTEACPDFVDYCFKNIEDALVYFSNVMKKDGIISN